MGGAGSCQPPRPDARPVSYVGGSTTPSHRHRRPTRRGPWPPAQPLSSIPLPTPAVSSSDTAMFFRGGVALTAADAPPLSVQDPPRPTFRRVGAPPCMHRQRAGLHRPSGALSRARPLAPAPLPCACAVQGARGALARRAPLRLSHWPARRGARADFGGGRPCSARARRASAYPPPPVERGAGRRVGPRPSHTTARGRGPTRP